MYKKTPEKSINLSTVKPKKKLGQNFLICQEPVEQLLKAAELKPSDIVLEVGPGLGRITVALAKKVKQVIAVEKDKALIPLLQQALKDNGIKNVKVANTDILNFQFSPKQSKLATGQAIFPEGVALRPYGAGNFQTIFNDSNKKAKYKVIGNLPYNIASAVVMKFLEAKNPPTLMVVMLQKEVAQRMCANPPHMSKLAVFTQIYSQAKIIAVVSKKCFYPQPKVDSAILRITPQIYADEKRIYGDTDTKFREDFAEIVKAGFSHPRKQLINNLIDNLIDKDKLPLPVLSRSFQNGEQNKNEKRQRIANWLKQNKIQPSQRAETLSLDDWKNLAKAAKNYSDRCPSK